VEGGPGGAGESVRSWQPELYRTLTRRGCAAEPPPLACCGVGLAIGCSDDGGGRGNLASWCRLGSEINNALEKGEPIPDGTFNEFAAAAPADIREASTTASVAFVASAKDAFEDPAVQAAVKDIETYNEANCS